MNVLITTFLLLFTLSSETIFDFTPSSDIRNWRIVDDVVMGGRSDGAFTLSDNGHGQFSGEVSLENNGGFSSVRYPLANMAVDANGAIRLTLKGDGNAYQFRVKHNRWYEYAYVHEFETTGDWQEITIPLEEMYPIYRGRRLNRANFNHSSLQEVSFLIGNGRPQEFRLLIDNIELIPG